MINGNTQRERKVNGLYFTRGDADVLAWLGRYHFLQPVHMEILSRRHIVSLRRRLRQLHQNGFVERLTLPLERDWPVGSPPDQFVYCLSRKGLTRAQSLGFTDERTQFNSEKKITFLVHDLRLTTFHLCLDLAADQRGFELLTWEQRRSELQDQAIGEHGERLSVNPDALFGLKSLALQGCRYFFLEMVNARESKYEAGESYLVRKFRAFQKYFEQKRHVAAWDIADFRVVTVLPTAERVTNLCEKLEAAGLGFKRFWLTDLTAYSLEQPEQILGKIFRTPRDFRSGTLYSLIE
jgi:hypothetical protein